MTPHSHYSEIRPHNIVTFKSKTINGKKYPPGTLWEVEYVYADLAEPKCFISNSDNTLPFELERMLVKTSLLRRIRSWDDFTPSEIEEIKKSELIDIEEEDLPDPSDIFN